MHESQMHEDNAFLTLTYDDAHLPEDLSLDVSHWQKFAKRVRKAMGPFRFLHCGEYGDQGNRPHYHACIFGLDWSGDRTPWQTTKNGDALFVSQQLTDLWQQGFSTIGALTFDSAAYVAQYCMKKATGPLEKERYTRSNSHGTWKVKPNYASMSRRPGIGKSWFDKYVDEVYPDDYVVAKGQKFRPPKYYDDLLEAQDPVLMEEMRKKRLAKVASQTKENTPERLRVKERYADAKYAIRRDRDAGRN